jgi:hypothetical protein
MRATANTKSNSNAIANAHAYAIAITVQSTGFHTNAKSGRTNASRGADKSEHEHNEPDGRGGQ